MDISLIIKVTDLQFCIHIQNVTGEGTVSQNFDIGPDLFFLENLEKRLKKIYKKLPVFWHKIKSRI